MADLVINGKNYNGVSSVKIPNSGGTQETFVQPSGDKNITANGTVDVSAFARAIVNVPTSVSGTKTITANGTYDIAAFAQAVVNVPTSGGITNIDTGTANPASSTRLYIPFDPSKGEVAAVMTWSDSAYAANRTCGHIAVCNVFYINSKRDSVSYALYNDGANGLSINASQPAYIANSGNTIGLDRALTNYKLSTEDTFNYIVFYKPVGNLSFGGAST